MKTSRLIAVLVVVAPLAACISTHQENAKLRMPWPATTEAGLLAYAAPKDNYPTVGGDILRGTAPLEYDAPAPPPSPRTQPAPSPQTQP